MAVVKEAVIAGAGIGGLSVGIACAQRSRRNRVRHRAELGWKAQD
jgi:hypothetical protein